MTFYGTQLGRSNVLPRMASTFAWGCLTLLVVAPVNNPALAQAKHARNQTGQDLQLSMVMGQPIRPVIYLPARSHVESVSVYPGPDAMGDDSLQLQYAASCPLGYEQTVCYYRAKYQGLSGAKWRIRPKDSTLDRIDQTYLNLPAPGLGPWGTIGFLIFRSPTPSQSRSYQLSEKALHSTLILLLVEIPKAKVDAFRGKRMEPFLIPIPKE